MNDRALVEIMARSYRQQKSILRDLETGCGHYTPNEIKNARYIVGHIDATVRYLNERDRFIIHHEVILGKTGKWYQDCLSTPSYYRHRKEAYRTFLRNLEI